MMGMNKVFLMGRLGADPESSVDRSGKTYAKMSLATDQKWKNQEGEEQSKTYWHKILVFGKQGEICLKYLKQGRPVFIEGSIAYFNVSQNEQIPQWKMAVNAEKINFLPSTSAKNSKEKAEVEVNENSQSLVDPFLRFSQETEVSQSEEAGFSGSKKRRNSSLN
jgi:single-strand DNA-binding protein